MSHRLRACHRCQRPCRGDVCRGCFGKRGELTVVAQPKAEVKQRGSWWLGKAREDFTALAQVMVVPVAERGER